MREWGSAPRRIVILTGGELRHDFFRRGLAARPGLRVSGSWCEGTEKSLGNRIGEANRENQFRAQHVALRNADEEAFFRPLIEVTEEASRPRHIPKGAINLPEQVDAILELAPDLLVSFGCSLIQGRLLEAYAGRFVNLHLGLSPWYRGSGTNFWAMVNDELECVGATLMHIDAGVDTGAIIHQVRADVHAGDTPHRIGHRLIAKAADVCGRLLENFESAEAKLAPEVDEDQLRPAYRVSDFTEQSVKDLYRLFEEGLVDRYLSRRDQRQRRIPLVEQSWLREGLA